MAILRSTKDNAVFISEPKTQGPKEPGWSSYTTSYQSISETFNVDASSTSVTLVSKSREGPVPQQGDDIIAKIPNSSEVYRGTFGNVDSVVSTANDITGLQKDSAEYYMAGAPAYASSPTFVLFNNDGSKIYSGGSSSDRIFEFNLSVAYDISTITYNNVFFSLGSQDGAPQDVVFNNDGTKMFMVGSSTDSVHEYILSTAYDISTVSYSGNSFSLLAQDSSPYDIAFNTDGTKFFVMGGSEETIFEYTLSTAFDITTLVYTGNSFSFRDDLGHYGIYAAKFTNNGTKLFVADRDEIIYEYNVTVPYDVTSISNSGLQKSLNEPEFIGGTITGMAFSADATTLITVNSSSDKLISYSKDDYSFTTSTADISTLGLPEAPTLVARDQLPELSVSAEPFAERCLTEDAVLTKISSTTTQFVGERDVLNDRNFIQLNAGDRVLAFASAQPADSQLVTLTSDALMSTGEGIESVSEENIKELDISPQSGFTQAIRFVNNGTRLFVLDDGDERVYQYDLDVPYDITTARSVNLLLIFGEYRPLGMTFSSTGHDLYVVGSGNGQLLRHSLTTPYTLSQYMYEGSYYVGSIDSSPAGIEITPDGSKFIFLGNSGNALYQLDLSIPFDISTITYNDVNVSLSSLNIPSSSTYSDIVFNSDGTQLYIVDSSNKKVYRLKMSTPYDITTAVTDNLMLDISSFDTFPRSIAFNDDESAIFIVGSNSNTISQVETVGRNVYTLEFDALSYAPEQITIPSRATTFVEPVSEAWIDNTNIVIDDGPAPGSVVVDRTYATVDTDWAKALQYRVAFPGPGEVRTLDFALKKLDEQVMNLPFLWDIGSINRVAGNETASVLNISGTDPRGLIAKPDGTEIYLTGFDPDSGSSAVSQISLTTGYDLTTNVSEKVVVLAEVSNPTDISFKSDGTRMFIVDEGFPNKILRYDLSTPWDIDTAAYVGPGSFEIRSQESKPYALEFGDNGSKMYVTGIGDIVYQYTLSTPYEVSTASYNFVSFSVSAQEDYTSALTFNNDGTKMYITGTSSDFLFQYTLTTPWDIGSASYDDVSVDLDDQDINPYGIAFNNDGTKFFMIGTSNDYINEYTLSSAYDINTLSYSFTRFKINEDGAPNDFTFNDVGTKLFVVGGTSGAIYQYSLSTPYSLSSVSYDGVSFPTGDIESSITTIKFNNTGTKIYLLGTSKDTVLGFNLAIPYDISTIDSTVGSEDNEWAGDSVYFSLDGTIIRSLNGTTVYNRFDFPTAWALEGLDRSTAGEDQVRFDEDNNDSNKNIRFKPDGTEMYISAVRNSAENYIYQYSLSVPFDVTTAKFKQQYEDKTPEAPGGTGILSSFFINPNTGKEVLISSGNNVYLFDIDAELFTDVSAIDSDLGTSFEFNDGWTNIN